MLTCIGLEALEVFDGLTFDNGAMQKNIGKLIQLL